MKRVKSQARLERRRKAWRAIGYPDGFKEPGSMKKAHPEGRASRELRRRAA